MSVRLCAPPPRRGLPRADLRRLRARAERVLAELAHAGSELSLALVDDAEIAALNVAWRRRRGPTDVLSFSLVEGEHPERSGPLLGDVVISLETAARHARAGGRRLDDELARLLVHGVLHLVGHDHARRAETRAMRAEERRLLRALAR
jgi:rRNA maturation RNase YbeY